VDPSGHTPHGAPSSSDYYAVKAWARYAGIPWIIATYYAQGWGSYDPAQVAVAYVNASVSASDAGVTNALDRINHIADHMTNSMVGRDSHRGEIKWDYTRKLNYWGLVGGPNYDIVGMATAQEAGHRAAQAMSIFAMGTPGSLSNGPNWTYEGETYQFNLETPVNSRGDPYPTIVDPRTGNPIPFPRNPQRVDKALRVEYTMADRAAFIREWYARGYPTPAGGWGGDNVNIHHIRPIAFGGGNDFWNLVPVPTDFHRQVLNPWWAAYP
jgi:hypothetical protein